MTEVGKFMITEDIRLELVMGSKGKVDAVVSVQPEVFDDLRLDEVVNTLFERAKFLLNEKGFNVNG